MNGPQIPDLDDSFSYDGYGVMLGTDNTSAASADTTMLYAGEQFDTEAEMYYNRARYYNPSNGLFNRVDPYAGNTQDPQSLHKYAYCHANPINNIDPSGKWIGAAGLVVGVAIVTFLTGWLIKDMYTVGVKDTIKSWDVRFFGGNKIQIKINGKIHDVKAEWGYFLRIWI